MFSIKINPIDFFLGHCSQIKIDDSGQVKMCYVENMPFVEDGGSDGGNNDGQQMV